MPKKEFKKLNKEEMQIAKLEQRRYIREQLKGNDYFFKRIGIDREMEVSALEQEVTEYGFNKIELDKNLEEKNAAFELVAIENNLSDEFNGSAITQNETRSQDAQKSLEDAMELLIFTGKARPHKEEEPLTEHEQVLKKIEELKRVSLTPEEREKAATEDLNNMMNSFFSQD